MLHSCSAACAATGIDHRWYQSPAVRPVQLELPATLQNPVSSAAWLGANVQLLAPLLSFTMDTRRFCEPLLRTKPLIIIASYSILSYIAVLVRPGQWFNPLGLYNFTQSFRFEWAGVAAAGMLMFMVVVRIIRKLLQRCQHSKVHPK